MILKDAYSEYHPLCKPRASGDDPLLGDGGLDDAG